MPLAAQNQILLTKLYSNCNCTDINTVPVLWLQIVQGMVESLVEFSLCQTTDNTKRKDTLQKSQHPVEKQIEGKPTVSESVQNPGSPSSAQVKLDTEVNSCQCIKKNTYVCVYMYNVGYITWCLCFVYSIVLVVAISFWWGGIKMLVSISNLCQCKLVITWGAVVLFFTS